MWRKPSVGDVHFFLLQWGPNDGVGVHFVFALGGGGRGNEGEAGKHPRRNGGGERALKQGVRAACDGVPIDPEAREGHLAPGVIAQFRVRLYGGLVRLPLLGLS